MEFEKFYEIFEKYGFSDSTLRIKNSKKFQNVWFGVMGDPHDNSLIYWCSSEEDNFSYDFPSLDAFVNAKIFDGNSLKDIWNNIELTCLDCISPEEYTIPPYEKSIVFNYKHKELATYEQLKLEKKAWVKFLSIPLFCLVLSLAYFVCSLTVIKYNETTNIITSSIFMGSLLIFIFICFIIADNQWWKKVKQIYVIDKSTKKTNFYESFVKFCADSFNESYRNENYDDEGLCSFGPFESCGLLKIKDAYFIFADGSSEKLEMVFLNDYAKVWNKQNNEIKSYLYENYNDVEQLLNEIKTKLNK